MVIVVCHIMYLYAHMCACNESAPLSCWFYIVSSCCFAFSAFLHVIYLEARLITIISSITWIRWKIEFMHYNVTMNMKFLCVLMRGNLYYYYTIIVFKRIDTFVWGKQNVEARSFLNKLSKKKFKRAEK